MLMTQEPTKPCKCGVNTNGYRYEYWIISPKTGKRASVSTGNIQMLYSSTREKLREAALGNGEAQLTKDELLNFAVYSGIIPCPKGYMPPAKIFRMR